MNAQEELFELITSKPGLHYRELTRDSSYSATNVRHHLRQLIRQGKIKEIKGGKNLRYYPISFSSEETILMGLLRQRSIRRILLLIATKKCTNKILLKEIPISASTLSFHIKKLIDESVIRKDYYYELLVDKDHLIKLIRDYKASFFDSLVDNMSELWDV